MKTFLHNFLLLLPVAAIFLLFPGYGARAGNGVCSIRGKVLFNDNGEKPGAYATVYLPLSGTGAVCNAQGEFTLVLPSSANGRATRVEFSYIGFETVVRQVVYKAGEVIDMETVTLPLQTIMLPTAFVTPGYDNPADYILDQVRKRAELNKKLYPVYSAEVDYRFETHDLPLVAYAAPKAALTAVKMAASLSGIGSVVRYALDNDDMSASVSLLRSVSNGKNKDSNARVTASNPSPLPDNVNKDLKAAFKVIDLFNLLYGDNAFWGKKNSDKRHFTHVGSYLWNDSIIDVLKWTDKSGKLSANLHVIEDYWGILKVEAGYGDRMVRCEARNIGGGFFMPVSLVISPSLFPVLKSKDFPKYIKMAEDAKGINKATVKRIRKVFEENEGKDIHPYVTGSFSVNYKK